MNFAGGGVSLRGELRERRFEVTPTEPGDRPASIRLCTLPGELTPGKIPTVVNAYGLMGQIQWSAIGRHHAIK